MAKVVSTLADFIGYVNTLYESDETAPTSGDEDYTVWTGLANMAINVWENEEGVLWKELFVKLEDAPDGDTTTDGTNSYTLPTLFKYPASSYVWVGGDAYKVIKQEDIQLYEGDSTRWCYFLMDSTPTLEFNPNLTMTTGDTIKYNYYKYATKLSGSTDTFEMSDPMFAVYYAVGELKKDEGDASALDIATQKLEGMRTKNLMMTWESDEDNLLKSTDEGLGV
jgi:hypothetical protein